MKRSIILCTIFITFALVLYTEAINNKYERLFPMKRRVIEQDDLHDDSSIEEIENVRRVSSDCERCGLLRRPCCFPNLCRRTAGQLSECYKVSG
ncbi:unnamed protein product [Rotaria socialis]|uniref:Uncharacterized protein n=1 Tax=Rotaria socialis TaxID=392032 RepID=A0A818PKX9_9BILA|nr:unnamed protein product [Rotaria socialis]CAF3274103.1 unnamed protein product [Rotaria socialis]CAF3303443.1 unnamed protein product [Rotaria socialis]CAF3323748.1 unnamed protein product [Rotaria socialis]CAF3623253.1 unnamed protein product [Rotaria socialis]